MEHTSLKEIPELHLLMEAVEGRFGRKVSTTYDFVALSAIIERETGELLSTSTLKRLWGYVSSHPVPRVSTLDILSRYSGHPDFRSFCRYLKENSGVESDFDKTGVLLSSSLGEGEELCLFWNPDRMVSLTFLGDGWFEVKESVNSKLKKGDRFESSCFLLGHPLCISSILRGEDNTAPYVAGARNGLTGIVRNGK